MTVTTFPLNPRTALSDLIAKVFSAPFAKTFSAPLGGAAAAAVSWFLSGGIAAANCIAAYDAKNAASLAASYDNLASAATTYDCTAPVAAPTWAAGTGWTFNGSTQFLKTSIVPAVGHSAIIRFSSNTTVDRYLFGTYKAAGGNSLFAICANGGTNKVYYWTGNSLGGGGGITPLLASGTLALSATTMYRNGISDGAITNNISTVLDIYIGCLNNDGSANYFSSSVIQAFAYYNIAIDSSIVALNTAMAAL